MLNSVFDNDCILSIEKCSVLYRCMFDTHIVYQWAWDDRIMLDWGFLLLLRACERGENGIVEWLLDHDKLHLSSWRSYLAGCSPLQAAANAGHMSTLEMLLTKRIGYKPKDWAVWVASQTLDTVIGTKSSGRMQMVELLVKAGAEVKCRWQKEIMEAAPNVGHLVRCNDCWDCDVNIVGIVNDWSSHNPYAAARIRTG